jgi:hypothetical protein
MAARLTSGTARRGSWTPWASVRGRNGLQAACCQRGTSSWGARGSRVAWAARRLPVACTSVGSHTVQSRLARDGIEGTLAGPCVRAPQRRCGHGLGGADEVMVAVASGQRRDETSDEQRSPAPSASSQLQSRRSASAVLALRRVVGTGRTGLMAAPSRASGCSRGVLHRAAPPPSPGYPARRRL